MSIPNLPKIQAEPLTHGAFAPYGEVIEKPGAEQITINQGMCIRHHGLATADVTGEGGEVIINIFSGQPYQTPLVVGLVERHPLGSQAFYPLGDGDWLVIVCDDDVGVPVRPRAFLATGDQGVNLKRNQWHGVLTPLNSVSDFLVVDRGGPGNNLEEFEFPKDTGFIVTLD